jgi:hypothetical protein
VLPWIYETICAPGKYVATTAFCIQGIADLQSYLPSQVNVFNKPCTSISGKFTLEDKKKNEKTQDISCDWKGIREYCSSTVMVDGKNMLLEEACPSECSASWCA